MSVKVTIHECLQFCFFHLIVTRRDCFQKINQRFKKKRKQISTKNCKMESDIAIDDSSSGNMDVDEEKEDSVIAKNNDNFLAKASMTESYSEILNSPTMETNEKSIESSAPIVIQKRRPSSLTRHHSGQCKCSHFHCCK